MLPLVRRGDVLWDCVDMSNSYFTCVNALATSSRQSAAFAVIVIDSCWPTVRGSVTGRHENVVRLHGHVQSSHTSSLASSSRQSSRPQRTCNNWDWQYCRSTVWQRQCETWECCTTHALCEIARHQQLSHIFQTINQQDLTERSVVDRCYSAGSTVTQLRSVYRILIVDIHYKVKCRLQAHSVKVLLACCNSSKAII